MNGLDVYNSGEQIDSLLDQMENMEQELTDKNRKLEVLQEQLREKEKQIQNLSSGNQKLKSQIQSVNSVLSKQGELLRQQTEKLEKYSGSDIIFQENEKLKVRIAESKKREKAMEEKTAVILSEAEKKEGNAERKLAIANHMMSEYQTALAKEVAQVKQEMRRNLQEDSNRHLHRKARQLSGMTIVLLTAYLVQLVAVLFIKKDTTATIPVWFRDRYKNLLWLIQQLVTLYQKLYLKMTTAMRPQITLGILILASVAIAVVLFFLIRAGLNCLLQRWERRWEFYDCSDVVRLKKWTMLGIAFMGFSISMVVVNLSLIPFQLNIVSWWILITGVMEFLYLHYDRHGF